MTSAERTIWENYLLDLGVLLREMATDARDRAKGPSATQFDLGYMAGFHRVVSLMQQQAEAFGIPVDAVSLQGIDPDRDLV